MEFPSLTHVQMYTSVLVSEHSDLPGGFTIPIVLSLLPPHHWHGFS